MTNNEKDWLKSVIKSLLTKNFYKKFITLGEHKIYIKNLYSFLKDDLNIIWLKEKPFVSKARGIYRTMLTKFYSYKRNERLKKLQKKYPNLQIIEAYYYLNLKKKFDLKNEDLEIFGEVLEILFAKLKKKK